MMYFSKAIGTLMISASLSLAAGANAETINFKDLNNDFEVLALDQSLSLEFFDSSLGTLDSITLAISGSVIGQYFLFNNTDTDSGPFSFAADLVFHFDLTSMNVQAPPFKSRLARFTEVANIGSGSQLALSTSQETGVQLINLTTGLDAFIGNAGEMFNLGCTTNTVEHLSEGGGFITVDSASQARCRAIVNYHYTPLSVDPNPGGGPSSIPEPASLLLLGTGLLGLAGIRRKARKD